MSSVGNLGAASSSSLFQSLQSIASTNPLQPGQDQAGSNDSQVQAAFEAAARQIGLDPSKIPSLRAQIEAAVKNAVGNAGTPAQQRAAIDRAIDGVLKQNGIDPTQFKAKLQSALKAEGVSGGRGGKRHRGHHGAKVAGAPEAVKPPTAVSTPAPTTPASAIAGGDNTATPNALPNGALLDEQA